VLKTILNTFKTVVVKFNLHYCYWVVDNLKNEISELEVFKKDENFTSQDRHDLTIEIMDNQKDLVRVKKKIKKLEEEQS
tara:strand:- start:278 stop:514 length:237 start_codon:yes stop_codon:yes gene_type:complete